MVALTVLKPRLTPDSIHFPREEVERSLEGDFMITRQQGVKVHRSSRLKQGKRAAGDRGSSSAGKTCHILDLLTGEDLWTDSADF